MTDPPYSPLPPPKSTPHIWQANLPENLPKGVYILEVQVVDMFDQKDRSTRLIQVGKTIGYRLSAGVKVVGPPGFL